MELKWNTPLANLTTVHTGGIAKGMAVIKNEEDLRDILSFLHTQHLTYLVVGGGSNLLFSDIGYDGIIVKNEMKGIEQNGNSAIVQSGTPLQELVDFTLEKGLSGVQKLTGIPGTIGGAIYGNAGAYGQTISDCLISVNVLHEDKIIPVTKSEGAYSYRHSIFKSTKDYIVSAEFEFTSGDSSDLKKEAADIFEQRLKKYPPDMKCPGSFFMNVPIEQVSPESMKLIPPEKTRNGRIHVGWLLETIGAPGTKVGGVQVADYHSNLFINTNNATSQDYYILAKGLAEKVKNKYGITLTPEVQLVGIDFN